MEIDHIFIFSKNEGKEADNLVEFGLEEGSHRIHKGQGTANRKFYFENFFLEILWVIDEEEVNQTPTLETQLGHRANFNQNSSSIAEHHCSTVLLCSIFRYNEHIVTRTFTMC